MRFQLDEARNTCTDKAEISRLVFELKEIRRSTQIKKPVGNGGDEIWPELKRKAPRRNVGQGLRHEACNKRREYDRPKTDTVQEDN